MGRNRITISKPLAKVVQYIDVDTKRNLERHTYFLDLIFKRGDTIYLTINKVRSPYKIVHINKVDKTYYECFLKRI